MVDEKRGPPFSLRTPPARRDNRRQRQCSRCSGPNVSPFAASPAASPAASWSVLKGPAARLEPAAAQVEMWFEPGPHRYLKRGEDFFCAPSRMLKILRHWAKGSHLKLNGKIEGDRVRIAPEHPYQRSIDQARARAAQRS